MADEGDSVPSILEYVVACLVGDPSETELGNLELSGVSSLFFRSKRADREPHLWNPAHAADW